MTSTLERGNVVSVTAKPAGSELTAATIIGATVLPVLDAADFPEDGGQVQVGAEITDYSVVDDAASTLTLVTPAAVAHALYDRVDVFPLTYEYTAEVAIDNEGDTVEARVPYALRNTFPEGVRQGASQEAVTLKFDRGEFVIDDANADEPVVDPTSIDPGIPIPDVNLSDGLPPPPAGAPTVIGLPRLLFAKIDGVVNHDAVSYEWHIATSAAGTPTVGGATAHHTGAETVGLFETLADGTDLEYDTDYFIGVFAYDVDAPAAFSGWSAAAQMDRNGTPDIAVGAITAAQVEAFFVIAQKFVTSTSGRRLELDNTGIFIKDSDGSDLIALPTDGSDFLFNGTINTDNLVVEDNMSLRGTNNSVEKNSSITFQAKTLDPGTPPTLSVGWPSVDLYTDPFFQAINRHGLALYSSLWVVGYTFPGGGYVQAFDAVGAKSGTEHALPTGTNGYQPTGGLVHLVIGGQQRWAVLCQDNDAGGAWKVRIYNDSWVFQNEWAASFLNASRGAHVASSAADHLSIVQWDTGDTWKAWDRDAGAGTAIGSTSLTTGTGVHDDLLAYTYTSADFGAARHVLVTTQAAGSAHRCFPFNTSGVLQSSERFLAAYGQLISGLAWDGTNFWSLSTQSAGIYKYGNLSKAATSTTYLVPYTWVDADAGGTGTHESQMSVQASKSVLARQCLTVTTPPIPDSGGTDDADSVKIYCGTAAARTSQWLQASPAPTVRTFTITNLATTGTNPPSSNNFPAAGAASAKAADGTILLAGDQSAPIEQTYTPVWTAASGSPNLGTTGSITGSWQRLGKKVHVEILMTFGGTGINAGTGAWAWSLPAGLTAAYSASRCYGSGIIDDASGGKVGGYSVGAVGGSATTVGLWGPTGVNRVGAAAPQVPATGDIYALTFDYFLA